MRHAIHATAVAGALALIGCGPPGKVREETIEVKPSAALDQAKDLLQKYSKGQRLGSEVTSFPELVGEIRKTDPERAKVLEQGFADLQKPKVNVASKAKEILGQLAPRMTGG